MTQHIFDFLRSALLHYGYWAVAAALLLENAGVPVPGETVLLLASFLAYSEHSLRWPIIILVGTIAATLGDNLGFALGHFGGRRLLDGHRTVFHISDATLTRAESLFDQYGAFTIFFARFVFGMRIVAGPMAGALRMPWKKFVVFNFLGAAVWVTAISGAGYLFGRHWEKLVAALRQFNIAVVLLVLSIGIWLWWRKRKTH